MSTLRRHPLRLLALLATVVLVAAACGDDDASDTADEPGGTDDTVADGADGDTTGATLQVIETDLGEVLADGDGFTVYVFDQDEPGVSNCTDECADLWPPVESDAAPSGPEGVETGTIERDDGAMQATVGGLPVYGYTPDTEPGRTGGQGVGGLWWAVGPDGEPRRDAAESEGEGDAAGPRY